MEWYKKSSHLYLVDPNHRKSLRSSQSRDDVNVVSKGWRHHRDRALMLLEDSIAVSANQDIRYLIEVMKMVRNDLRFDLPSSQVPTSSNASLVAEITSTPRRYLPRKRRKL